MSNQPHYSVIEDDQDENGYGDYLYQYSAPTYSEAVRLLKADSKCSHIDYWDGKEWHQYVTSELSNES